MTFWYILAGVIGFLVLFVLGGSVYAYIRTYKTPKERPDVTKRNFKDKRVLELTNELLSRPYEPVYVKSYDGKKIFARYYEVNKGAPLHIMMHGYRGFAEVDFSGGAKVVRELGHNMLIADMRGHGKSDGTQTCFGIKERFDALALARYAYERFGKDTPIFLNGASMGGNTVLMATALDLPKTVIGVISDGAFSSPSGVIKYTIDSQRLPKILLPFTTSCIAATLFGGFNINASSPVKAVKKSSLPILLFHGTTDKVVPYRMAQEIFEASCSSDKFLYTFEGAGHVLCYYNNTEQYENAIRDFTRLCLEKYENNFKKENNNEGTKGN